MMKKTILVTLVCLYIQNTTAQVLFTYGKYPVALEAFKASFEKSNPDSILSKSAFQNYLNLFINFKLKVKAAYDLRMDTLPNQIADQLAFEEQVKPIYLLDSATLNMLVNEAVEHRLQEVDLSHIFIAYKQPFNENGDNIITTEEKELAKRKLQEVQQRLKLGESFEEIALAFSNDPEAKYNRAHLGFIKAFTLPYAFEQTAYGLKDGEVSLPVESEAGIHLFKREGSRNIEGNLSVAQILIAIPENAQEIEIKERELLANTIYQEAIKGASFDSLVAIFSEDRSTNTRDGIIVGMETGDYDPVFERQIRGLKKDGQISPVFKTAFGFHILKRISQDTLKINQAELNAETKELVLQD
ncbi:MAG: hypothetical protein RL713_1454, partial [Bacteroidota bacterium]